MEKGQWEPIMCNKALVSLSNKQKKRKKSPYKLHNRKALGTLDCAAGRAFSPLQSRDATHTKHTHLHTKHIRAALRLLIRVHKLCAKTATRLDTFTAAQPVTS